MTTAQVMQESVGSMAAIEEQDERKPVTATPKAIRHILRQMQSDPQAIGFRLEVKRTGCSGWMYVVDLVQEPRPDDRIFHAGDGELDIYIDEKSFGFVHGMEIDFISEGLTRQLKFNNPNVKAECGCGESFSV